MILHDIKNSEHHDVTVTFDNDVIAEFALNSAIKELRKIINECKDEFERELEKRYMIFDSINRKITFITNAITEQDVKYNDYNSIRKILTNDTYIFKSIECHKLDDSYRIISRQLLAYEQLFALEQSKQAISRQKI